MSLYFFSLLISFIFNAALIIPFINFLYQKKLQRQNQKTKDPLNKPTPIFDQLHQHKKGTPIGGGILIITTTTFLFLFYFLVFSLLRKKIISVYPSIFDEIKIILFTFISFSLLGLYDDLNKIFFWKKNGFFGLRLRHKFILELILGAIVSYWLYDNLKIGIINIPYLGVFNLGIFYIIFATLTIVSFANAVNITDGLDGLAAGCLMIALFSFWLIARSIIDIPTSLFISSWLGGVMAFLYFNIYPARLFLGDSGALSFGATLAVIGLILGKAFALIVIGGIFVIEISTSFIQLTGKKFFKKKVFPVAPFHLWLQLRGWEEPKIVMRLWLINILFSIFGLMIAFAK
jgi:phospho-N-acetylmuramoyl-pentapeptide-transferase